MMSRAANNHRRGRRAGRAFTLVELLVVIGILIVLSSLVLAVFNTGRSSDKMRSAARIAQSAFLGAKDRALHAKDLRGVRLTRDLTNPNLVNGFVYLAPIPTQLNVPCVTVTDPTVPQVTIHFPQGIGSTFLQQDQNGLWKGPVVARVPGTGPSAIPSGNLFPLLPLGGSPNWVSQNGTDYFATVRTAWYFNAAAGQWIVTAPKHISDASFISATSCDLFLGNELLPFHQPVSLSSGCVIDLLNSSPSVQSFITLSVGPNLDLLFTARGALSGFPSGLGPLHLLLRGLKDATAGVNPFAVGAPGSANPDQSRDDRLILTVFPQTGLVQIFEIDPTDSVTNSTGVAPPDGLADNLFNLAQKGKAAGR